MPSPTSSAWPREQRTGPIQPPIKKQHHKPLYDGTTFHRVIPGIHDSGRRSSRHREGDPGYAFDDEFDPDLNFDVPGTLAMANSGPNTNGSQFFITEQAYDSLNQHYTIFGQCDEPSVEVVKTIARVQRDANDKPLESVVLKKVTIVPEGQPVPAAASRRAAAACVRYSLKPYISQSTNPTN